MIRYLLNFIFAPSWLVKRWWSYDRDVLWPSILEASGGDIAKARQAYWLHMQIDPAYWYLDDKSRAKIMSTLP